MVVEPDLDSVHRASRVRVAVQGKHTPSNRLLRGILNSQDECRPDIE